MEHAVCENCRERQPIYGCREWRWDRKRGVAHKPYRALCQPCIAVAKDEALDVISGVAGRRIA